MKELTIKSAARIHLGFIELNPNAKRVFGSLGLTISKYKTIIKIEHSKKFLVIAKNKKRILYYLKKLNQSFDLKPCKITVIKEIPEHSGLGSGTQLSLSLGKLLSKFYDLNLSEKQIASKFGRGRRSGIGIGSFKCGGFIVDGGKLNKTKEIPSIIFNCKWPIEWKIILIFDNLISGIHGKKEFEGFQKIRNIKTNLSEKNSKSLVLKILPGLKEKNFKNFVKGIQEIQDNTAKTFSKSQGGLYASTNVGELFQHLKKKKIFGYGQSSWGPTSFLFCENQKMQDEMLLIIKSFLKKKSIKNIELIKVQGHNQKSKINERSSL